MTIAQFEHWSLIIGINGLIIFMFFIIYNIAKESKAGRMGTFALFLALGVGMFGYIAKQIIILVMDI